MQTILELQNLNIAALLDLPESGHGLALGAMQHHASASSDNVWLLDYMKRVGRQAKFGFVYIIEGSHKGVLKHKIGKANNLSDRVRTFNVKLPFDIKVVASFYVRNPLEFESELHGVMRANRIAGEWFDLTTAEIHYLCLLGMARETHDMSKAMLADLDDMNREPLMPDREYIDYLESMLVIHNIQFSRKLTDHGQKVIADGKAMG